MSDIRKIAVILLILFGPISKAQDFIVTLKGDTISGEVNFSNIDSNVDLLWVEQEGEKRKMFSAIQVRTVMKDSTEYMIVKHIGYQFMKVIKKGYVSLLNFKAENSANFSTPFLYKLDGSKTEIPKLNFKKPMASFFSECDEVSVRIKNKELVYKDLETIIDSYNLCIERQSANLPTQLVEETPAVPVPTEEGGALAILDQMRTASQGQEDISADLGAIIADVENKIRAGEVVPSYLLNALRSSVKENDVLLGLIGDLEGALKE